MYKRQSKYSADYFDWIIKTINVTNAPILTFYHSGDRMYEHLIVVRNTIAFVLVMRESELVACSYTTDRATLLNLDEYCVATFHRLSRFLAPLEPAMLKKSSPVSYTHLSSVCTHADTSDTGRCRPHAPGH